MMLVLITGGAGSIAGMLRSRLAGPDRMLRLFDVAPIEPPAPGEQVELVTGSVTDPEAVRDACTSADAVLHLGGISGERDWPTILTTNIDGTQIVLDAARRANVPRVVLASSNHAAGFWPRSQASPGGLSADVLPRPDTYYGASKAAMEALGALYHERFGMDVTCLRIGSCQSVPSSVRELATWLSPDDMGRLAQACLGEHPAGFRIVWGVSRNTRRWWSLAAGEAIGFHPRDDAESFADSVAPPTPEDDLVGGPYCAISLGNDPG